MLYPYSLYTAGVIYEVVGRTVFENYDVQLFSLLQTNIARDH